MRKRFQYCLIALLACFLCAHADDGYNPPSPPEPFVNYSVVVTASPAVAGTVSGTGKYSAGQNVNISASPKSNYTFSHWTINNYYYGNAKNFTYVVGDSVASFVAHFLSQQKVTVAVSPVGGGTVSGAGSFTEGTAITLSVTPKTDYTFLHWTINGFFFSDQQSATYTVGDSAANFVAVLKEPEPGPEPDPEPYNPGLPPEPMQKYKLKLLCVPEDAARATGQGNYSFGETAKIQATALSPDYAFDSWTINGTVCSNTASFNYTMPDSSVTMVAHFKSKWNVTVVANPAQAGTVSGAGYYLEGTNITLSAKAKNGYVFRHWTLNGVVFSEETSFPYTVGDSAANFIAFFDEQNVNPEPYNPDLPPEPMGKVSIYAETPAGYYFVKWNDGVTDNPRLVNSGTESNYTPVFELITFDINTTAEMCQGEVYLLGDKRLTTSGVYKAMLKSQLGADSLVTLNLTVHPSYHIKNTVTIAEDGSYDFFGETLTDEGTYIKEFTTTKGCDSIFIVTIRKGTEIPEPEQTYSISFLNYDGTELQSDELEYGQTPSYQGETPVKPADAQYTYTFTGWTPEIVAVTEDATYTASYSATEIIEPPVNDTIIVPQNENVNISTLGVSGESVIIVQPGGQLTVDENANINVLIVISNGVQSGQVHDCDNLNAQRIYLEYVLNPDPNNDDASPNLWYAIAVPFQVDIKTGITRAHGKKSHVSGVDFQILEYDGMLRAQTGKGWVKKNAGSLEPGTFYMIGIEGKCNRWLFEKKSGADIQGDDHVNLNQYFAGNSDNGKHNGWNGMGNTKLEYMDVDFSGCEINYVIMYNNLISDYVTYLLSSLGELCVGQPFFVQAPNKDNMYVNFGKVPQKMPALRARNAVEPFITFTLTEGDNQHTHYPMYLTMHEDAETTYSIGRDIMHMDGGGNRVAKFWMISQDSTELSAHGIAIPETETVIPLGLFAPKNGEYLLNMSERATDDFEVELLHNGTHAATLFADQPLVLNLNAGTTTDYALRIRRRMLTGLENTAAKLGGSQKILYDGHLYILRGEHIFDAQGKLVK